VVGILAGYSWWGNTASVTIVERQLSQSQAKVRTPEKPVKALEIKLGIADDAGERESTAKAY
jgi:hypothetical protein